MDSLIPVTLMNEFMEILEMHNDKFDCSNNI